MTAAQEVVRFASEYINVKSSRSLRRKQKISEAYERLTGKKIVISCNTCYIEAIFTILNLSKMTQGGYELKRGYVAQFQDAYKGVKSFTNDKMTDELAEEYLRRYPERAVYFARMPQPKKPFIPSNVKIVKPKEKAPEVVAPSVPDPVKLADALTKPTEMLVPPKPRRSHHGKSKSKSKS